MVKPISTKEAYKISKKIGFDISTEDKTFYATNEAETEVWEFDSKKERNWFVANVNAQKI